MKKLITLLMSCSLALVAGAMAQQDDNSPAPKKKQHGQAPAPQEADQRTHRCQPVDHHRVRSPLAQRAGEQLGGQIVTGADVGREDQRAHARSSFVRAS